MYVPFTFIYKIQCTNFNANYIIYNPMKKVLPNNMQISQALSGNFTSGWNSVW